MRLGNRGIITSRATLIGVSLVASSAPALAAEYKMTVNKDRLINSANEPQNWLMMNGDYGSTRYSKLAQINRDNVKNLRMVWPLAERARQPTRMRRIGVLVGLPKDDPGTKLRLAVFRQRLDGPERRLIK
jgi:hypothetical protein